MVKESFCGDFDWHLLKFNLVKEIVFSITAWENIPF